MNRSTRSRALLLSWLTGTITSGRPRPRMSFTADRPKPRSEMSATRFSIHAAWMSEPGVYQKTLAGLSLTTTTSSFPSPFMSAMAMGYYTMPKRIKLEEIAARQGVKRSTFEEHLRKAELKILQSVRPYARLTFTSSPEDR